MNLTRAVGGLPANSQIIIVHYDEIGLKGKNRPTFIGKLAGNIERATRDVGCRRVERVSGRLLLCLEDGFGWEKIKERLQHVFGIANYSLAIQALTDLECLKRAVSDAIANIPFLTFRISARRAFKTLPWTSQKVNEEIGTHVLEERGKKVKVDLAHPEVEIFIEVMPKNSYVYLNKASGPGGLPVGISGTVTCLLSGGIDSPVAAYRMMKRGCRVLFIHFHSSPFLSRASQEKAVELVELLTRHQYTSELFLVPFGEIQRQIVLTAPAPYRILLYRRLMVRIAEIIARDRGAKALVTGDSLAQVSSQTLENLAVVEAVATLPIFRPLIGMDKSEIAGQARSIGTFEISILPDQDCCQLFIPKNPTTHGLDRELARVEERMDLESLVQEGVTGAVLREFVFP